MLKEKEKQKEKREKDGLISVRGFLGFKKSGI